MFAIIFLVVVFKVVGLLLSVCGRLLGAVLSLAGFIISLAVGTLVFGLSAAFSVGNCRSLADSKIGIVKNYYAEERWKKSTAAGMKKQEDNR